LPVLQLFINALKRSRSFIMIKNTDIYSKANGMVENGTIGAED